MKIFFSIFAIRSQIKYKSDDFCQGKNEINHKIFHNHPNTRFLSQKNVAQYQANSYNSS